MALKPSKALTVAEMEKMKALLANGMTYNAVARELKRSPHTIKKYAIIPKTAQEVQVIKEELSDMFEGLAKKMLTSISDEDIQKINAYQRTVSAGISTDKMRLLRDQSTINLAAELSLHERIERELKILQAETKALE